MDYLQSLDDNFPFNTDLTGANAGPSNVQLTIDLLM